jgi:CBS domain containing-hemolysin-like protein
MWQLGLVPVLIALNAFFVAAEYALVAIRTSQIEPLRQGGYARTARALTRLKDDMASAIGAIQVCITMTNLLLGWIGEPALSAVIERALDPLDVVIPETISTVISTAVGFIIVTLLTVVLSELLPKALTLQHTLVVARFTMAPMLGIMRAIAPLVWLMNGLANLTTRLLGLGPVEIEGRPLSADEIRLIAAESAEAGALTPRERSLILNALALGRRRAREIMTPRVRIAYLDVTKPMSANLATVEERLFTRFPVCDGAIDKVIGIVDAKALLTAYREEPTEDTTILQLIIRPPIFVPVTVSLDRLLAAFAEHRTELLLLVDEFGTLAGMVTTQDVIDELVSMVA